MKETEIREGKLEEEEYIHIVLNLSLPPSPPPLILLIKARVAEGVCRHMDHRPRQCSAGYIRHYLLPSRRRHRRIRHRWTHIYAPVLVHSMVYSSTIKRKLNTQKKTLNNEFAHAMQTTVVLPKGLQSCYV